MNQEELVQAIKDAQQQAGEDEAGVGMLCFWCGDAIGTAIVPKNTVPAAAFEQSLPICTVDPDYEPCTHCKDKFDSGMWVIETSRYPIRPSQPPISEDEQGRPVYPTGRYVVAHPESFVKVAFGGDSKEEQESILEQKHVLLSQEDWNELHLPNNVPWQMQHFSSESPEEELQLPDDAFPAPSGLQ